MTLFGMVPSEYKLTDLLSAAGATIGVIIAGTIFLQFLSTKYTELFGRYSELTSEYRSVNGDHGRHRPLQTQIQVYRSRLVYLNRASWLGAIALLCLIATVLAGGFSMVYPPIRAFKALGSVCLLFGLLLMAAAVSLEWIESVMARKESGEEIADLDEEARQLAC